MDQIKIGRFIAQKRKDAGLTQVQLAEKLGVTDKSVSKWERGICLPDVSLYQRLCGELGMTLNEFFAGETIDKSEIEARSEENILGVARDGSNKRNKLKKIILVLSIALAVLAAGTIFAVHFIKEQGYFMNNYVRAYDLNDSEATMKTILSGNDADAQLFKYDVDDNYKSLTIDMDVYEKGKLVKSEGEMGIPFEDPADRKGIIAITGNHETGEAVITVATSGGTIASVSNVTLTSKKDMANEGTFCWTSITQPADAAKDQSIPMAAFYQGKEGVNALSPEMVPEEYEKVGTDNDHTTLFTCRFE